MSEKEKSENNDESTLYPSAKFLVDVCYKDYQHQIDTYDKIYEKVNIALCFSGVILLVILNSFDYTLLNRFVNASNLELFSLIVHFLCSLSSSILILWAVLQLLSLMKSKKMSVLSAIYIRNKKLYNEQEKDVAMWLIDQYTKSIADMQPVIKEKQKKFDSAILKVIISIICFSVVLIIQKGL